MKNLGDLINVAKDPNKIAIVFNNHQYSYGQLNQLVCGISAGLVAKGIKPLDRVAIISTNSVNYIATYLGILKIGGVAVLINAKLPKMQIDYMLEDSKSKLIFTDREVVSELPIINFDHIDSFLSTDNTDVYDPIETDPAVILYTAGSTSIPKGVILSHKHRWIIDIRATGDWSMATRRFLVSAPCYHMNGLSNVEIALAGHATVVLMSQFNARECMHLIQEHKINTITAVPSMLVMILKEQDLLANLDLSSIKEIRMSSAPVSRNLYNSLKSTFSDCMIIVAYGITEVGPGIFTRHPNGHPTPELSVGYPMKNIDYRLVDGVLQIRSPAMMMGYNNIKSIATTEDGYFITNDIFKVDHQGFYYFVGRADDMFVSGGNNIYPRQIEEAIETHPAVISSAVIGLPDEIKGMKPYAFVVVNSSQITDVVLTQHLATRLAPSHLPRKIWILEQMPLLSVNKIDKSKLIEMAKNLSTANSIDI
jgi:acyl-CoA synthetase (AMP-forming)/AMP-acid ligase II